VSVRLSVANYEALAANALRRGLRAGENPVVARVDDLDALAASSIGKIEIESIDDGREGVVFENLIRGAVHQVFTARHDGALSTAIVEAFEEGCVAHTGSDRSSAELASLVVDVPALAPAVERFTGGSSDPAVVAAAVEFILEGLHLSRRLNKDDSGASTTYRGRG
jgi:magnesium chelatase subunit I